MTKRAVIIIFLLIIVGLYSARNDVLSFTVKNGWNRRIIGIIMTIGADIAEVPRSVWVYASQKKMDPLLVVDAVNGGADATEMLEAVIVNPVKSNAEIINILIDAGADFRIKDNNGRNLLMTAVANNADPDVINILIKKGISANSSDLNGKTVLMYAAETGVQPVNVLIKAGADVNGRDRYGKTVLMYAIPSVVEKLIFANADVNGRDKKGKTVLMYAAESLPKMASFLAEKGADVNAADDSGKTVLMYAVKEICRANMCFEHPAEGSLIKNLISFGANVKNSDKSGMTVLMYAVKGLNIQNKRKYDYIINMLIDAGAEIGAKDINGRTVLMHGLLAKKAEDRIDILLPRRFDINATDKNGTTALMYAAGWSDCFPCLKKLKNIGADFTRRDRFGKDVFDYAKINFGQKAVRVKKELGI